MTTSFFLAMREGLEAALIVGILLGALDKLNHTRGKSSIWIGTAAAILVSIVVGVGLNLLGASFEGRAEEIFEGITMLLAAVVLTTVIFWMQTQSRALAQQLESDVQSAIIKGSAFSLFLLAFLAVIREGVELAFFLTAASINSDPAAVIIGAVLGLAVVTVLALLLFKSLIRLNLGKFFQVTSIILIIFAAGLVAHGIHEFNEVGLVPAVIEHVWDINHILDEKSSFGELMKTLVGYNANPSLSEVIAYLLYFVVLWTVHKYRATTIKSTSTKASAQA